MYSTFCRAIGVFGVQCDTQQQPVDLLRKNFLDHMVDYGLSFGTKEEFQFRFDIYLEHDKVINEINSEEDSFEVGHNMFSTLTKDEAKKYMGYDSSYEDATYEPVELDVSDLPASVDWRNKHAVNPIQNQGHCGACWAFSAISSIESAHFIKTGKLVKLSEQQMVSCAPSGQCHGGGFGRAMDYGMDHPIELESDYPYKSGGGAVPKCQYNINKGQFNVTANIFVPHFNVEQMKAAIAEGPVSVSVQASSSVFMHYRSGIIDSAKCGTKTNHAVVAIGYGKNSAGKEYLIINNSWTTRWGIKGWGLIALHGDDAGICGILENGHRPETN